MSGECGFSLEDAKLFLLKEGILDIITWNPMCELGTAGDLGEHMDPLIMKY